MKFTKDELLEALKAKVSEELVTPRTLNESLEVLYGFVGEEDELEDFVKKSIPILKSFEGQARKQKSDYEKEKLEWEKNHPSKKDDRDKNGEKDKIDLLLEEIQNFKNEREQEKKAKAISDKRNSLKSALKGKDVKNEEWINDQLELIHIDSETDVDALTERLVNSYNKFNANTPPNITPGGAGGGAENLEHEFDDIAEGLKE